MPAALSPGRKSPLETEVLQFSDLQALSGRLQLAAVTRWATAQGIPFRYDAKGGIWTTVAGLNYALGIGVAGEPRMLSPDILL